MERFGNEVSVGWSKSNNNSTGNRVLDVLKAIQLSFWKNIVQRVAEIKSWVNKRCANCLSSIDVYDWADASTDHGCATKHVEEIEEIWPSKVRWESKIITRLRTEAAGETDVSLLKKKHKIVFWLTDFEFCWVEVEDQEAGTQELLKHIRLEVIQPAIAPSAFYKWDIFSWMSDAWKDKNTWVSSAYRWWLTEKEEIGGLRGVVYSEKSCGPSTDLVQFHTVGVMVEFRELIWAFNPKQTIWQIRFNPVKHYTVEFKPFR